MDDIVERLKSFDTEAEANLRECQQQLDFDGVMVGVSRQALNEVLDEITRLRKEVEGLRDSEPAKKHAIKLLRTCYVTLAFAFRRLHESSRSRDGELCLDFQKVRAEIEKHFQRIGVKL